MAQIALGVIGAGIGSFFGNPMLGFSVGMTVGGMLFPPHPNQGNSAVNDLKVTGSAYGSPIPQIFGASRIGGNIIWSTDLVKHTHGESFFASLLGESPPPDNFTISLSVLVCKALKGTQRIRRIWAEEKLIYDADDVSVHPPVTSLTIYDGNESQTPDLFQVATIGTSPANRGVTTVMFVDLDLAQWGNRPPNMLFEVDLNGGTIYLSDIITDLFGQAGVTPDQLDVTEAATTSVDGYLLVARQSVAQQVEGLLNSFFFDITEVDGILKMVKRGGSSVATVPAGDLAAWSSTSSRSSTNPQPTSRVTTRRRPDLEIPQRLELSYIAKDFLYAQGTVAGIRFTKKHVAKSQLAYPLVLTEDEARKIVEALIDQAWLERQEFEFTLPLEYLQYAPGDILTIPLGDNLLRVRITQQDIPFFGAIKFSAVLDDDAILTQHATATALTEPTFPSLTDITDFVCWTGNALRDADASAGTGLYMGGYGPMGLDWPGAQVWWSRDDGATYQFLGNLTAPLEAGHVNGVIPAPPAGVLDSDWDTVTTITVTMDSDGTPSSVTDADVLVGANAILCGDEVIQFVNATPTMTPNQYHLTRLLRGQRGTDAKWLTHADNERFVILQLGPVVREDLGESVRNKDVKLKAVTVGSTLALTTAVDLHISGDEWKCYSSCHGAGSRDMSSNLTITWQARTRSDGELHDGSDAADPDALSFEVEVYSDNTYGTLLRTITGISAETTSYSAADQTTDFGSAQSTVYIIIYRIGHYGRGYPYQVAV